MDKIASSNKQDNLRLDIQGLRAIAVLAVVVFHINKNWLPGGFIGVDIFFVISGYLISSIILKKKEEANNFSFKEFYIGRLSRIAPAYYCLLAISCLLMSFLLIPADYNYYFKSLKYAVFFISNQYFSTFGEYFAPDSSELSLLHTWSLAVEMQFYLGLPIVLLLLKKKYLKILLPLFILGLTIFANFKLSNPVNNQAIYYSTLFRIPEFLVGVFLSLIHSLHTHTRFFSKWGSNCLSLAGLLMIGCCFFFINEKTLFPGIVALLPCFGGGLLLITQKSIINSFFLSNKIMVKIGDMSYSIYLWHWFVLSSFRYYFSKYLLSVNQILLAILIIIVVSYLSYKFIETPFRGIKSVIPFFKKLAPVALFSLLLILPAGKVNSSIVDPMPVELTRYAADEEICHGKIVGDCIRGDKESDSIVLVIGDSHAAQLNYFFDEIGKYNKIAYRVLTASSCVTIPGFDSERIPQWGQEPCKNQITKVMDYYKQTETIIIAGMWSYQTESKLFLKCFEEFLNKAKKDNKKIIVMAQIPVLNYNMQRAFRYQSLGLPVTVGKAKDWFKGNDIIKNITVKFSNADFLDLTETGFFLEAPFYKEILIYHDSHHLNEYGAKAYGELAAMHPLFLRCWQQGY